MIVGLAMSVVRSSTHDAAEAPTFVRHVRQLVPDSFGGCLATLQKKTETPPCTDCHTSIPGDQKTDLCESPITPHVPRSHHSHQQHKCRGNNVQDVLMSQHAPVSQTPTTGPRLFARVTIRERSPPLTTTKKLLIRERSWQLNHPFAQRCAKLLETPK